MAKRRETLKTSYRIGWDVSHQEFTIEDEYYHSILKGELLKRGVEVKELTKLDHAGDYDVLVLNYPEKRFQPREVEMIRELVGKGKRVLAFAHYLNEDGVGETVNSVAKAFGIEVLFDEVSDPVSNDRGRPLFVVTSKVKKYNRGVKKLLIPVSASLRVLKPEAVPIVLGERTARGALGPGPVLFAEAKLGKGRFIVGGQVVFWDNYSIRRYDNLRFALNLLGIGP